MLLEIYLKQNNLSLKQIHLNSGIAESTIRSIDKRDLEKWNIEYFDAIGKSLNKSKYTVMRELEKLQASIADEKNSLMYNGKFDLENRRYIGNKNKLMDWISKLIVENTVGNSFFDVFAGTGVVSKAMLNKYDEFILNDFLYSSNIIFHAFFDSDDYDRQKLIHYKELFQEINDNKYDDDYFSNNYGNKYFSVRDAKVIGEIRTRIDLLNDLNDKERNILIASLLYSVDKIANTVGHYDAFRKNVNIEDKFVFELIKPMNTENKKVKIYREDSNLLIKKVSADIAFIDPPYNSRQYSRFYHVLESIVKWDKPKLVGTAMKPPEENMSDYCRCSAPKIFEDLINNLNVKNIVVTYNNTYDSRSSSSRNKITLEQIKNILEKKGKTEIFETDYYRFNAGKTDVSNHKELVFITKVGIFGE